MMMSDSSSENHSGRDVLGVLVQARADSDNELVVVVCPAASTEAGVEVSACTRNET